MRLTVLGSSPSWPNPGEAQSGYLLDLPGGRLLLDLGNGVLSRLRTVAGGAPDAIVLSHLHPDHIGDLFPLTCGLIWGPLGWPRPTLYLPPGGRVVLSEAGQASGTELSTIERAMDVREYRTSTPLEIAGARLSFTRTTHSAYSYLIRVEADGRALAYTGDTPPNGALGAAAAGCDLLLAEATHLDASEDGADGRMHLTAGEAAAAAAAAGATRLVLTHLAAERRDESLQRARAVFTATELALPGAVFEV